MNTENYQRKVADYLKLFYDEQKKSKGQLIFRGQANEKWGIASSAGRRLNDQNKKMQSDFISYHVNLIANARNLGYGKLEAGIDLSDLEILAEIQHYGGATCLVDFTTNFLVALWMATEENIAKVPKIENGNYIEKDGEIEYEKEKKIKHNGKIFWLDLGEEVNQRNIVYYNQPQKGDTIQHLLTKVQWSFELKEPKVVPCFWLWDPTKLNDRIIMQDSIFMFGLSAFPKKISENDRLVYKDIVIEKDDKKLLREELETIFGISAENVFYDFQGFAYDANHISKPISTKILPTNDCLQNAKENIKKEQYSQAINSLNIALECKKENEKNSEDNKECEKCKRGRDYCYKNNSLGEIYLWKAKAHKKRNENEEALLNLYLARKQFNGNSILKIPKGAANEEKRIYKLLCETYKNMIQIDYSRTDYISAYGVANLLARLFEINHTVLSKKKYENLCGSDAYFILAELSINMMEKDMFNDAIDKIKELQNESNFKGTNGELLFVFLKFFGNFIFEKDTSKQISPDELSDAFNEIDKLFQEKETCTENKQDKQEYDNILINYFYWEYSDFITCIKSFRRRGEKDARKEYIVKNEETLILLVQKAQDTQDYLLNQMFAGAMATTQVEDK